MCIDMRKRVYLDVALTVLPTYTRKQINAKSLDVNGYRRERMKLLFLRDLRLLWQICEQILMKLFAHNLFTNFDMRKRITVLSLDVRRYP